jgi:hypothetical protein
MKQKVSLEQLLVEITEMMQLLQKHRGPVTQNVTPEVLKKLDDLEQAMAAFNEIQQKAFQAANLDIEKLKEECLSAPSDSKEKKILQRAKAIEQDAQALQSALSQATGQTHAPKKSKRKTKATQSMRERRKLFKPLKGDNKWIPL